MFLRQVRVPLEQLSPSHREHVERALEEKDWHPMVFQEGDFALAYIAVHRLAVLDFGKVVPLESHCVTAVGYCIMKAENHVRGGESEVKPGLLECLLYGGASPSAICSYGSSTMSKYAPVDSFNRAPLAFAIYNLRRAKGKLVQNLLACITVLVAYGADPSLPCIGRTLELGDNAWKLAARESRHSDEIDQALRYKTRRERVYTICMLLLLGRKDPESVIYQAPENVIRKILLEVWRSRRDLRSWPIGKTPCEKCVLA